MPASEDRIQREVDEHIRETAQKKGPDAKHRGISHGHWNVARGSNAHGTKRTTIRRGSRCSSCL